MKLTKNFKLEELACKCGCDSVGHISPGFVVKLQKLRNTYGPITVTSCYRCETWNAKVGGAPNSMHLQGRAADCLITDSKKRHRFVQKATELGLTLIVYDSFIHVDDRDHGPLLLIG